MNLSNKAINEYQQIYKKEFNEEISFDEARTQGEKLVRLFQIIYKPIPCMESDRNRNNK